MEEDITLDDVDAAFSSSKVRISSQNNVFEPQIYVVEMRVKMSSLLLLSYVLKHGVDALEDISDKKNIREETKSIDRIKIPT